MNEIRTGIGWDVHRLAAGRPLILGGVTVPSELGLEGHSDADILSHAIIDALLGAAALGDIGMHFPDTDPQWKDADSLQFLAHAAGLVRDCGFTIVYVDSTVILEQPKLKDFRQPIRESLARTLGVRNRESIGEIQDRRGRRTGGRRPLGRSPGHRHAGALTLNGTEPASRTAQWASVI